MNELVNLLLEATAPLQSAFEHMQDGSWWRMAIVLAVLVIVCGITPGSAKK